MDIQIGCPHKDQIQYLCGACKRTAYCSEECQRYDWIMNNHDRRCSQSISFRVSNNQQGSTMNDAVVLVTLKNSSRNVKSEKFEATSTTGPRYNSYFPDGKLMGSLGTNIKERLQWVEIFRLNSATTKLPNNKTVVEKTNYELLMFQNYLFVTDYKIDFRFNTEEHDFFKGIARAMLCLLIREFQFPAEAKIILYAGGHHRDKPNDQMGLVRMYQTLSFSVINHGFSPEQYIETGEAVPMETTIGRLLAACETAQVKNLIESETIGVIGPVID